MAIDFFILNMLNYQFHVRVDKTEKRLYSAFIITLVLCLGLVLCA